MRKLGNIFRFWILSFVMFFALCPFMFLRGATNIQFRHITEKQGLKHTWVQHINKDSKGYMWFSTMYGAYRYDGFRFEEYRFFVNQGNEVANINLVYEDERGNIFFGTNDGLYKHNPIKGQNIHYTKEGNSPLKISSTFISDIEGDGKGGLFIAGNMGLDLLTESGVIKHWPLGYIRTVMKDSRNNIWIGTITGKVYRMERGEEEFKEFRLPLEIHYPILDIFQSKDNHIWISTDGAGLIRYRLPQKDFKHYSVANGSLLNNIVRQVIEDKEGVIYVATERGLVRITDQDHEFITSQDGNIWSLNDNAIYSLYCDSDNNLWVGTFFGGVNVMYLHFEMFNFLLSESEDYSSNSKVVSSILPVGETLYIGTENFGIFIIDKQGIVSRISTSNSNITSDNIHSICVDNRNNLWIGSYYGGLFVRQKGKTFFRNITIGPSSNGVLSSNNIYSIYQDSRDNLWIGTQYGGLYQYDYVKNSLKRFNHSELNDAFIWDIHEDSAGDIWLACYGKGIYKLSASEEYLCQKVETSAKFFITICELIDGRILAGTEKEGLVCINPLSLTSRKLTVSDGLTDNTIYGVLQDEAKNIWISTNTGLCQIDEALESFTNYTIADGLPANRFNYNACTSLDGKLYFGCINGVVIVDPQKEIHLDVNKPIRFNNLYVNNVKQSISEEGVLKADLNEIDELKLKHTQNTFSIDFSCNIFGYNWGQSFAYKMIGIDEEWHMLRNRRSVDFMGLKPGKYTLVVAGVDDGNIMGNTASLRIRILPVWWQSMIAKITLVLIVLLIVAWLIYVFLKSSKQKHELELEKLAREKDKEINEIKFRFFINISHEFKTPLSLILGPVEQFMHGRVSHEMKDKYFGIIKKNADKLLSLINELLAFRDIQFISLKIAPVNIFSLIQTVISRHDWLFDDKDITLEVDVREDIVIEADASKIETIFDNLLSNAYKHTPKGGKVKIQAVIIGDYLRLFVEDNGVGISKDKLPYIFERFFSGKSYDMYSSGVGLSYVKSIVEQHKGTISVASEVGKFTRLEVMLPIKSQAIKSLESDSSEEYRREYDKMQRFDASTVDLEYDKEEYLKVASETVLLIVEDDHSMRELLMDHFGSSYKVIGAETGESAAKLVRETKVDIVISDVMLTSGMSGFELCNYIKNSIETSHIKVILMTVLSEQNYRYQGYKSGADAYVVKPFTFSMIELLVRNLIISSIKMREGYKIEIDFSKVEVKASNTDEQFIRKIVDVIFTHLSDSELSVDDLCMSVGMSKATLYRKLKALTGLSTNEFIQSTRLKYAARILSETDKNISDVAYEVGFSDPYYFSRAFKKLFGKSPRQWREELEAKNASN